MSPCALILGASIEYSAWFHSMISKTPRWSTLLAQIPRAARSMCELEFREGQCGGLSFGLSSVVCFGGGYFGVLYCMYYIVSWMGMGGVTITTRNTYVVVLSLVGSYHD